MKWMRWETDDDDDDEWMEVGTVDWVAYWKRRRYEWGRRSAGNFIVSVQNLWPTIYNVLAVYVLLQFILLRINT